MAHDQVPDHFNWVAAQAKCSAQAAFERLRVSVREDVQHRNGLFERHDGLRFEFDEDEGDFEVSRHVRSGATGTRVTASVRFSRSGRRIYIQGEDIDIDVVALAALDPAGQCRFVVGEALYADWEIRRLALEHLFFEESDDDE